MAPRDRLLVSGVNGGGVLLVDGDGVERLSTVDTAGLADTPQGLLWALQSGDSNELRRVDAAGWERHIVAPGMLDLHDVLFHDGDVYVACTDINAVLRLRADDLVEVQRWTLPGERDACHVNALCMHGDRLLATRFGRFTTHRGYKGATRGAGEVFDVTSGEVLVSGLSQPHSLVSRDGALWVCDSEGHALLKFEDGRETARVALGGYARGLAFGDGVVYVGLSRGRNDPASALASACVVMLDLDTLVESARVALPVDEVYAILPTRVAADDLRRSALQDMAYQTWTVAHERNVARIEVHEERLRTEEIATRLHASNLHNQALQAQLGAAGDAIADRDRRRADAARRVREEDVWAGLLQADIARLHGIIEARDALVHERDDLLRAQRDALVAAGSQALALQAAIEARDLALEASGARAATLAAQVARLQDHVEAVERSRSWRWTRPLRRVDHAAPMPLAPFADEDVSLPVVAAPVEGATDPAVVPATPAPADLRGPARADVPILDLAFDTHAAPRVTILVTAYGQFDATLACLRSIRAAGDATPFEVLLVEDASGDPEMGRFARVPGLRYHAHAENLGFLQSVNAALPLARGDYVHLLNNDVRVTPGWLDALVGTFALFHDCGIAGARLLDEDGRQQEAGGIIWNDATGCNFGRGDDPGRALYATTHEADYVSGAAILVERGLLQALGGFDARYVPAYYEDTDLAWRIRARGLRTYVQAASLVFHTEGLSHGTDPAAGGKAHQARNREVFLARWSEALQREQWRPGEHAFLARDRSQLKKSVLVVDRHAPQTDRDAGSRAIWQVLRVLHVAGFSIRFWSCADDEPARYVAALRAHGVEVFSAAADGPLDAWLAAHGRYLDHAVISRPMIAADTLDAVRRHVDGPVVYYGHDIHHQRIRRQAQLAGDDPAMHAHADALRELERDLWQRVDLVLYPSAEETAEVAAWLGTSGSTARAATVPLFAYQGEPVPARPEGRDTVLFVGGFEHAPNEDGVLWFTTHIWPHLAARVPGLHLVLVGAAPTDAVQALAGDRIEVTGQVSEADLVAHYARARVVVAPLRFGAGVKGKVVEGLWHGAPCVCTPVGAQGLEDANSLRVVDAPDAFADAVAALAVDDAAWRAASRDGQAFVHARFSMATVQSVLSPVLDATPYPDVDARRARVEAHRPRDVADG